MGIGDYVKYYEELMIGHAPLIYTCPVLYYLDRRDKEKRFCYATEVDVEQAYEVLGNNILEFVLRTNIQRRCYYIYMFDLEANVWESETT